MKRRRGEISSVNTEEINPTYVKRVSGLENRLNRNVWFHIADFLLPHDLCALCSTCREARFTLMEGYVLWGRALIRNEAMLQKLETSNIRLGRNFSVFHGLRPRPLPQGLYVGYGGMCLSKSGKLVIGSASGEVCIMDPHDNWFSVQISVTEGLHGIVYGVCSLPDERIAISCKGKGIQIWNIDSLQLVMSLCPTRCEFYSLCVDKRGMLLSGCEDGCIYLWDISKEDKLQGKMKFEDDSEPVSCLVTLENGSVGSIASNGTVRIWDVFKLECTHTLVSFPSSPICLASISWPQQESLGKSDKELTRGVLSVGCRDGTIVILDQRNSGESTSYECIKTSRDVLNLPIISIIQIPSGNLISASASGAIQVWNPEESWSCTRVIYLHQGIIGSISILFDPCTMRLLSMSRGGLCVHITAMEEHSLLSQDHDELHGYRLALDVAIDDIESRKKYAKYLLLRGDLDAAGRLIEQVLNVCPTDVDALICYGRTLLMLRKIDRSIDVLERVHPDNSDFGIDLDLQLHYFHISGCARLMKQDEDGAIAMFDQALIVDPQHVETLYERGRALYNKNDVEGAISMYEKALKVDPNHVSTLYSCGVAFQNLRNDHRAIELYERVLILDPSHLSALYNKGNALYREGDFKGAICMYDRALVVDAGHTNNLCNYGSALMKIGELDRAIDMFEKSLKSNPKHLQTLYKFGSVLVEKNRLEEAMGILDRALTIDENHMGALHLSGVIRYIWNDTKGAIEIFDRVLALNGEHFPTLLNYGKVMVQEGKIEEGIDMFHRVLAIDPDHLETLINLIIASQTTGKLLYALEVCEHALRVVPGDESVTYLYESIRTSLKS